MAILKLLQPWAGPNGRMKPGDYPIPGKISVAHAKCAVLDGAGKIIADRAKQAKSTPKPPIDDQPKEPAKRRGRPPGRRTAVQKSTAPENKAGLDGTDGSDCSDGTEPDAGAGGSMSAGQDGSEASGFGSEDHSGQ